MDDEISKAKMRQQVDSVRSVEQIVAYHGWEFSEEGLQLFVALKPRAKPDLRFIARLSYDGFPQRAPSLTFVNPETKEPGTDFWPRQAPAFTKAVRRQPPQLCIEGLREFHEQLHQERPWNPEIHTLGRLLESMQAEINKGYPG